MIDQLRKRLFVLGIVTGCLFYVTILAVGPWVVIVWFLTKGS